MQRGLIVMYLPKKEVNRILKNICDEVYQTSQNVFNKFPTITFEVLNNSTSLLLDNSIAVQDISVQVDIWTETSEEASDLLSSVEELMRNNYYRLDFSGDIPNGDIYHITTRFVKKV